MEREVEIGHVNTPHIQVSGLDDQMLGRIKTKARKMASCGKEKRSTSAGLVAYSKEPFLWQHNILTEGYCRYQVCEVIWCKILLERLVPCANLGIGPGKKITELASIGVLCGCATQSNETLMEPLPFSAFVVVFQSLQTGVPVFCVDWIGAHTQSQRTVCKEVGKCLRPRNPAMSNVRNL